MEDLSVIPKLFELSNLIRTLGGESKTVDAEPLANKLGIDLERVMDEINTICETEKYFVGGHMNCTRWNVIPYFKTKHKLYLDRDHAEGLAQILSVHYKLKPDY